LVPVPPVSRVSLRPPGPPCPRRRGGLGTQDGRAGDLLERGGFDLRRDVTGELLARRALPGPVVPAAPAMAAPPSPKAPKAATVIAVLRTVERSS
jgi:hypothetical protein